MHTAIIPSTNRAAVLHDTVVSLLAQTERPAEIVLAIVDAGTDILPATRAIPIVRVVISAKGSVQQRNTALDHLDPSCTLVTFFDDDVELHPDYLCNCRAFMAGHPEVAGISGRAIADGTLIGEISRVRAVNLIREFDEPQFRHRVWFGMTGFDMTVRRDVADRVRFDDRLRLYALYEDFDFSVRCRRFGTIMSVDQCVLVHLRTGSARISPVRLGYAQLVNPLYLCWKGSHAWYHAARICARSLLGNMLGSLTVRQGISRRERRGRLWGNALGIRDVLRYGPRPEGIQNIG